MGMVGENMYMLLKIAWKSDELKFGLSCYYKNTLQMKGLFCNRSIETMIQIYVDDKNIKDHIKTLKDVNLKKHEEI